MSCTYSIDLMKICEAGLIQDGVFPVDLLLPVMHA